MAMITELNCNIREAVHVKYLDGNLFSQDVYGNAIRVIVMDGNEPATLAGTVSGTAIREDGSTVALTDSRIDGNVATVVLPAAAYAVPGVLAITIKISDTNTVTTLAYVVANVYRTSTDTVVDPGIIIPSITSLIEQIAEAVASIPADYSSLWAALAETFNASKSGGYAVGEYVTYDGVLYRFKNAHTGSWSSSDVDAVNLGSGIAKNASDISDLKSALTNDEETFGSLILNRRYSTTNDGYYTIYNGYYKSADGTTASSAKYKRTAELSAFGGKPVRVKVGSDFELAVLFWASNGESYEASKYTRYHSETNGFSFFVEPNEQIAFNIRKKDQTSITSEEETLIKQSLETYTISFMDDIDYIYGSYLTLSQTKAIEITATQDNQKDFNDYTTPGNYKVINVSNAQNILHIPYPITGRLVVMTLGNSSAILQAYITSAKTKANVYLRNLYNNAWTEWRNINPTYDSQPTQGSESPVTSGAVFDSFSAVNEEISKLNSVIFKEEQFNWLEVATAYWSTGWRTGYYDSGTGEEQSSKAYLRITKRISFDPSVTKITITAPVGYGVAIFEWNADDEYIGKYGRQEQTEPTASVTLEIKNGYKYGFSVGYFSGYDSSEYLTSEFVNSIILKTYAQKSEESVSDLSVWDGAIATAPTYRIPNFALLGKTYVNDLAYTDGEKANITQGLCSDGKRYLFWNIAPMGNNLGRNVMQRIRKWDTWRNESVGLSEPGDWGHCEDSCFVPAWCPGFDNGNVDRLYVTDFDYSTGTPTGRYIHVIDANTLDYITSFQTVDICPNEWNGVAHITFNQERGLFCMKGGTTIDGDSNYWVFLVFDMNGNPLRGARVHKTGTGIGIDSDENYIYATRTVSSEGVGYVFCYVIDWNLNPVARFQIGKFEWEAEGMCHIGSDIYLSWNQEYSASRKNTIEKTRVTFDYHEFTDTPPYNWPSTDGIKLSTWTHLDIQS